MNKITRSVFLLACITLCACLPVIGGCNGWALDYGTPAAQFDSRDAVAFAPDYLGKKVSVRGTVQVVDTSNGIVKLRKGVTAHFPRLKGQIDICEVGKIAFIDGIVSSATPDGVTLKPCLFRDPDAPFDPLSK